MDAGGRWRQLSGVRIHHGADRRHRRLGERHRRSGERDQCRTRWQFTRHHGDQWSRAGGWRAQPVARCRCDGVRAGCRQCSEALFQRGGGAGWRLRRRRNMEHQHWRTHLRLSCSHGSAGEPTQSHDGRERIGGRDQRHRQWLEPGSVSGDAGNRWQVYRHGTVGLRRGSGGPGDVHGGLAAGRREGSWRLRYRPQQPCLRGLTRVAVPDT